MLALVVALQAGASIMAADGLVQFMKKATLLKLIDLISLVKKDLNCLYPIVQEELFPTFQILGNGGNTINNYSLSSPITVVATDTKSFESRLDEYTDRIHKNLMKKINSRQLGALA